MSPQLSPDCGTGCHSHQHGQIISAAIIRGTAIEAIAYLKSICQRYCYVSDKSGKSALHTASSCGKKKLVKWLLAHGVNVNQKDLESGYTPLHRALFYGFIHIACTLIDAGGNLTTLDHDALTPLDHVIKDRPGIVEFSPRLPTQVYLWGDNANYNLGQSSQQARSTPECLEVLHREGQTIVDVSMSKFHTVFLTNTGQVYSCGHGHGGRLGLDTDGAPVISPRQVKALAHTAVTMIAAAHDHSMMLTEGGQVWTCGLNEYHQLGQNPPVPSLSSPRPITWHKTSKQFISGIGAGRYHSAMWNSTSLYTFGLNAGQMGHHKNANERTIVNPRLVTSLVLKEGVEINSVGVSDGAVVVNYTDGDIYVMHQYQTRQVASKQLGVIKVACIGGQLDPKVGAEGLTEHGGVDLKIAALVGGESGYLYLWTAQNTRLVRCLFLLNREITLTDFCLNRQGFGLVTKDGEAFSGVLATSKLRKSKTKGKSNELSGSSPLVEFLDKKACETIRLTKIYALHRTVAIRSDSKGRNFAALQNDPKSFMMEIPQVSSSTLIMDIKTLKMEASTMDAIHDVEIVSGNRTFPAHSYVLAYHSDFFRKKCINTKVPNGNPEHVENYQEVFEEKHSIKIPPDVAPQVMEEILEYIYTGTCQLTRRGPCEFKLPINDSIAKGNINTSSNMNPKGDVSNKSAFSVYKKMEESGKSNKNNKKNKKKGNEFKDVTHNNKPKNKVDDPIRVVEKVAKRFGLAAMESALKMYQLVDKCVQLRNVNNFSETGNASYPNRYNRKLHEELCDVMIQSKDGDLLGAHKCILAARLEYFHAMLGSGWMETKASKSLSMPLPTKILSIVLDYLYEDEAEGVRKSKDAEFVCNVLAVADQFLCPRLIEICEVRLSELLSLKNAAELLEFSNSYHASQLKKASMQFICLNLETLLENGSLLMLSSSVQYDLSDYYRAFIPRMSCRMLTPYDCLPYSEDLQQVLEENPIDLPDSDEDDWDPQVNIRIEGMNTPNMGSAKKKKRIHRTSSCESRPRKTSTSSQLSFGSSEGDVSELGDEFEALTFDDLEERTSPVPPRMYDVKRDVESVESERMKPLQISPWQKVKKKNSTSSSQSNISPLNSPDQEIIVKQPEVSKINNARQKSTSPQPIELSKTAEKPIKAQQYPTLADAFVSPKYMMQAKSSGKMGKVSQKQRKKMALGLDSETANMQEVNCKPSAPAWGGVALTGSNSSLPSTPQSPKKEPHGLASIIQAEETRAQTQNKIQSSISPAQKNPTSTSSSMFNNNSFIGPPTSTCIKENYPVSMTSPNMSSFSSLTQSSPSFHSILQEETFQREILQKEQSKPLAFIQLEDKAIEELLEFYGASESTEERITVVRVKSVSAKPLWNK